MIHGTPKVMLLAIDLYENLIQVPLPIGIGAEILDAFPADLGGEYRAEPIPPKADRFVAYVDATLVQQVLDILKRKRETDIHHHRQANDFWATMEVLERVAFCHCKTLRNLPIRINRIPSDNAGVGIAAGLIEKGTIGKGSLAVTLIASSLSEALGLPASELHPSLLHIEAPLHCRRRGAEMKIIAGDIQSLPDKALIRALNNAHIWVRQMKTGASVKQIAATTSISESYITRVITLAFLSPRIQRTILAGTQPDGLTMETLVRRCIPRHWPD